MARTEIEFPSLPNARLLYGMRDGNLKYLENELGIEIRAEGNLLRLTGANDDILLAQKTLVALYEEAKQNRTITAAEMSEQLMALRSGDDNASGGGIVCMTSDHRPIRAKTENQKTYVNAIRTDDIVFGIGPAGTGKTYLAMALAVDSLMRKKVKRIVLVRPAVEAGERLGFLPGDMAEKVNPYLRPLFDALYDMVDVDRAQHWLSQGSIEVAPLAFMRGRTLNSSFIILDEAQNSTQEQMKMFLTRLGFGSKAVITGDLTQTDLTGDAKSGLQQAVDILDHVEGISIVRLNEKDIVRHPLVQKIVLAYEKHTRQNTDKEA
ncbi:MAG: PhoH family protein [Proteobacteria bacterium]|nr:PhoH family protein [Pseudomonadota bacterium]